MGSAFKMHPDESSPCNCPGPGYCHLSPRLQQQPPHEPPCSYSNLSPPLVISSWALTPRKRQHSPACSSSPDLTPERQPLCPVACSARPPVRAPCPQPLGFPHVVPGLSPSSAQAKDLSVVGSSFSPHICIPSPARSSFKLYPKSDHIFPPRLLPLPPASSPPSLGWVGMTASSLAYRVHPGAHMAA